MTRNPNLGLYAIAVAIAVVGALWLGVPVGTLAVLGVALACPLMMLLMMGGMHGGMHGGDQNGDGGARRTGQGRDIDGDGSHDHR